MTHRFSFIRISLATLSLFAFTFATARAEHEGKIQILLLGDSSTAAGMPRVVAPKEPQFEDVIRLLLAAEADLPPTTVIPFSDEKTSTKINSLIRAVASEVKLTLFDIYPRYAVALKSGPDTLNYRRYPLSKSPENLRGIARPYVNTEADPKVVVLDNRLDAIFGHLPGWFSDRHPNSAGYNVIAAETAKFLAPVIRERRAKN